MIGYIYGLFDSRRPLHLWEMRYIGKTIQAPNERLTGHRSDCNKVGGKRRWVCNWFAKVEREGGTVVIRILETHEAEDKESLNALLGPREVAWIAEGRSQGWDLTNGTDGGEGMVGYHHTSEAKAKISKANSNPSPETRARKSVANRNRSPEARAKLSESSKGNQHGLGYKHTPEDIVRIIESNQTRIISEETRAKHRANFYKQPHPRLGTHHSPESKAKIGAATRERNDRRRQNAANE